MPKYRNSFNGQEIVLTADSPEQAATAARLYFAGRGRAKEVEQSRAEQEQRPEFDWSSVARPGLDAMKTGAAIGLPVAASVLAPGMGGVIGSIGRAAASHPVLTGTAIGAAPGVVQGDPSKAVSGGMEGALYGLGGKAFGALGGKLQGAVGEIFKRGAPVVDDVAAAAKAADPVKTARAAAIAQKAMQDAERHALQVEILKKRLSGEMPTRSPRVKPAPAPEPEVAPIAAPVAPEPVTAPVSAGLPAAEEQAMILKLQQLSSMPGGQKIVRDYLAQQPPEIAQQLKMVLARGQAHPPPAANPMSAELARLLGQ